MDRIKTIDILFTDGDLLHIPSYAIGRFWVKGIHEEVVKFGANKVLRHKICKSMYLEVFDTVDDEVQPDLASKMTPMQKLVTSNNIQLIEIHYEGPGYGDESDIIAVPFKDKHCGNKYQKNAAMNGVVCILISKKGNVIDYCADYVNDENIVALKKDIFFSANQPEEENKTAEEADNDDIRFLDPDGRLRIADLLAEC